MNKIQRQVSKARRRLMFGRFMRVLCWAIFGGLLFSVVGVLIPKVIHVPFVQDVANEGVWLWSWVAGGCVLGLITAAIVTWKQLETHHEAAVEVDRRFELKERLSSAMALGQKDAETESGQALIKDATDCADMIDVRDRFEFQPSRRALLPLIPLVLLIGLLFVPNRAQDLIEDKDAIARIADREKVKTAMKEIKKKLEKKKKMMTGLKDAKVKIENMERHFDDLAEAKTDKDKKEALVKLNDIKKQLADRRKDLGDSEKLKESLNKLKDVGEGAAKQLTEALKQGDMKEAQKAIKNLADKMRDGKMTKTEKMKLAKDMKEMAEQLQKMVEKQEQKKRDLKEKVKAAMREGDLEQAAKLQEKLDKMESQEKQMGDMKKMAEKMQQAAQKMQEGNGQPKMSKDGQPQNGNEQDGNQPSQKQMDDAAQSLEDLAEQMESLQKELEEMENLEDLEASIEAAKGACNGCDEADGPEQPPQWNDFAKGKGKGHGERERDEDKAGGFKSNVDGWLQRGETVVTGHADGNNLTGKSLTEARELVESSMGKKSDPLENVKLHKRQREHVRSYFDSLRKGE